MKCESYDARPLTPGSSLSRGEGRKTGVLSAEFVVDRF